MSAVLISGTKVSHNQVKSGPVWALKRGQKVPNWTSESGGGEADGGEDNLASVTTP